MKIIEKLFGASVAVISLTTLITTVTGFIGLPLPRWALWAIGIVNLISLPRDSMVPIPCENGELDKIADDESKQPSLKKMKQVDSQLFKIRKKLGSIIADNDPDKFI